MALFTALLSELSEQERCMLQHAMSMNADECEAQPQPQPHNKPWIAAPSISGNTVIIIPSSSIGPRSLGAPSFQSSSAPSQSAAPPSLPSSLDRGKSMTKKNNDATTAPIPLPNHHIHRTHSEVQLAQDQLVADYQDGKMYERIREFLLLCSFLTLTSVNN